MNHRLLIVEDVPSATEVAKQIIHKYGGFEIVATVTSDAEAIALGKELQPQLILIDISLPSQYDLEILKQLRSFQVPTEFILIAASTHTKIIREALHFGVCDYIVKPFTYDRLKKALDSYVARCKALESKEFFSQIEIDVIRGGFVSDSGDSVIIPSNKICGITDLPKGLNALTLRKIVTYLSKQPDAKSAVEVSAGIGLSRVTARRYLEFLEKIGKLKLEVQYGSVGRPVNRYQLLQSFH